VKLDTKSQSARGGAKKFGQKDKVRAIAISSAISPTRQGAKRANLPSLSPIEFLPF
jgi:hypothetical protein